MSGALSLCTNCGAFALCAVGGTGESICARCQRAAIAHGYERAPVETLTRVEAEQLIEDCAGYAPNKATPAQRLTALRALSTHWIGHAQDGLSADDLEALLHEYIDECALADRATGPMPDDETDLTAPE